MTLYFDPARRVVAVTPPPAVVRAPQAAPAAGYFDPSKPRVARSRFPTEEEIAAVWETVEPAYRRTVELLAALPWNMVGGSALELFRRRVVGLPRCEACGALAGGEEYGHRAHCPTAREAAYRAANWWLFRDRDGGEEVAVEEYDDSLPF